MGHRAEYSWVGKLPRKKSYLSSKPTDKLWVASVCIKVGDKGTRE